MRIQPKDKLNYRRSRNSRHLKLKSSTANQVNMVSIGGNVCGNQKDTWQYTKEIPQVQEIVEWIVWQKISRLCTVGL